MTQKFSTYQCAGDVPQTSMPQASAFQTSMPQTSAPQTSMPQKARALDFVQGCVSVQHVDGGWVLPVRFTYEQQEALYSCAAWHPGLYRDMAACSAGMVVAFQTDASSVDLEVRLHEPCVGTKRSFELMQQAQTLRPSDASPAIFDGFSYEVNAQHKDMLLAYTQTPGPHTAHMHTLRLALTASDTAHNETSATFKKPLKPEQFHDSKKLQDPDKLFSVRIFLPSLQCCELRYLYTNGTVLRPLAARPQLLLLGDSITQGFICGDPADSWACSLAKILDFELINQGIGGQVFMPESLPKLANRKTSETLDPAMLRPRKLLDPACIVVSFGVNYRYEAYPAQKAACDIERYCAAIHARWPHAPCFILTPLWYEQGPFPTHPRSCIEQIPDLIRKAAAPYAHMQVVDGRTLLDHDPALLSDGFEHPNAQGHACIAARLATIIRS